MTPRSSSSRRRSSKPIEQRIVNPTDGLPMLVTMLLVTALVLSGPLVLGGARPWFELPLLTGVALLMIIQGLRLTGRPPIGVLRKIDAIDIGVVLFVVYAAIRTFTSPAAYDSRLELLNIIGYAGIFFTCRYGLANRSFGIWLLLALAVLGGFETWFGFYLSRHSTWFPFGDTERLQLYYLPRWIGTYGCPNHYASLLVMACGAALALGSFSKLPWPVRIVLFYFAGVMVVGLLYSGSRGGLLSFVAAILALTAFGLRNGTVRWWVPILGMVLVLTAAGVAYKRSGSTHGRFEQLEGLLSNGRMGAEARIELAFDALHIAREHPFLGTGPGTFVFIHPRYQGESFPYKAVLTHDDYLNCLDDYGLIGFGLAMFFVWAVTLKFCQPLRADNRWQDRAVIAAGVAAWAALLIHSATDFNLHIPANAVLLFALTGLALGRMKEAAGEWHWSSVNLAPFGRWFGWAIVLFSLGYGLWVGRTAWSALLFDRAFSEWRTVPTDVTIARVEQAVRVDPGNAHAWTLLGDLHRYSASRRKDIDERVDEGQQALNAYQRAVALNSIDDTLQGRLGLTFDVMRRYPEAYFSYAQAAREQPYNGQFWYWLGNHYWQRGMLLKAEQAYRRALHCPHGWEGSGEALTQLNTLPGMQEIPIEELNADPLAPPTSDTEHPPTLP